ncbi:unnamed protein product [Diamesa hyperborea]
MSSDSKSYKEKIKSRYLNNKKKRATTSNGKSSKKVEPKVQKISEKYLAEELQVENSLKQRKDADDKDEYSKVKQTEVDFFCDPFSSIPLEIDSKSSDILDDQESEKLDSEKSESHSGSVRSNESPTTHLASSYIGADATPVIEKFELTRITFDNEEMLYFPNNERVEQEVDEKARVPQDEGLYVAQKPHIGKGSNRIMMCNRLTQSDGTNYIDGTGDLKNFENLIEDQVYRLVSDKKFIPIYMPPVPMYFSKSDKIIYEKKFLKIFVSRLVFDQHNLFTTEHLLAKSVENLFNEYKKRCNLKSIARIQTKLNNLRLIKTENSNGEKTGKSVKNEEIALNNQIKLVRSKLHVEEKYERNLLKSLLENWKNLKSVRTQQSYSFTKIGLKIYKSDVDVSQKQVYWQQRYDSELNEMIEEEFDNYHLKKQLYKEFMRSSSHPDNIAEDNEIMKKPRKPDIDKIVAQLNEQWDEVPVEEPELNVILTQCEEINDKKGKHKERLKKINRVSYQLKLSIDNEIVATTKHCKLENDFCTTINSAFIMQLTKQLPETIKLLIFENKRSSKKLAEIIIPLPDDEETFEDVEEQNFEFTSKKLVRKFSKSTAVMGKNVKTKKLVNIAGKITIKQGWTHEDVDHELKEPSTPLTKEKDLKDVVLSQSVLKKWFDKKLLNPMDPDTGNLITYLNTKEVNPKITSSALTTNVIANDNFRFVEDELAFCSAHEFNNNERFNLLTARYNNELQYKNKKFVPQFERELEFERDRELNIIDESSFSDPIDLQRFRGKRYLKKVYEIITNHCDNLNRDKMNTNILMGDQFPTFASIGMAFMEIFGPKRPLKPTRRTTSSRASCKINEINNFNIVVTVVRASNVPVRYEEPAVSSRKSSNISNKFASFKTINTNPFVFVSMSLKDHSCRTTTAEATNPTWNEQLRIPFNINSDQAKRVLSIDLYDEVVEDLIDNVTEVYQRISSKWLGSLKIPISTIYSSQRIDGTFEVTTPQILLGYSKPKFSHADQTSIAIDNLPDMSKKTHISLFISLEPNVEIPELISAGLECIEVDNIELYIKQWFLQLKLDFPARAKNPLVTLLNGKRACITRLLNPLSIPFEKTEFTECQIRRFVSLIPINYEATNNKCAGLSGVWLSNNHILSLLTSSNKDLGVLLTCYYLELGIAAWLVLGTSILSGETCFVLIKEGNEFFLVDPASGKRYSSKDIYCPLTFCYCLVNQYNVWANVQKESRVFMSHFDVNRSYDWRPLFHKVVDIPNGTVHELLFKYERSYDSKDLQKTIQAKIIKKVNSWRSHRKTIWNRYVSENLRNILGKLEDDLCFENDSDDNVELLNTLFSNYKVTGYTLNTKYTNLSLIMCDIKSTGIFLNLDNKVEFAVSVYVKEYSNNILSVWVFLMSLIPKN